MTPLGLPLYASGESFLRYPTITLRNLTGFGGNTAIPLVRVENTFQWSDTLTLTLGAHAVKVGGDVRRYQLNNFQPHFHRATIISPAPSPGLSVRSTSRGWPISSSACRRRRRSSTRRASTPIGCATRASASSRKTTGRSRRGLTLNLGLRWERDGAWREKDDRWGYFDFTRGEVVYPESAKTPFTTFPYPFRFDENRDLKKPQN